MAVRQGPPWGWPEWFLVSQAVIPALLFVPGLSVIRTATRIASYAIAPAIWAIVWQRGPRLPGADSFPARPWLFFCMIWLGLSILHPNGYSLVTASAQAVLYIAIFSPAFWAPSALVSSRQIGRLMAILFLCNALSALLGIAQVYRPATFNPPVIPALQNRYSGLDLMYETADGRKIMRPCGLTDTPGGASPAGAMAALIGLCWALRPISIWKRLASLGLAFLGVAVIYYSQVRLPLVMLAICLVALTGLFVLQRNIRQATMLASGGLVLIMGALAWVAGSVGDVVTQRFGALVRNDPTQFYFNSRGAYVQNAFEEILWQYPLGYGMGWWGMIYGTFGDPNRPSPVWVEVMWPAWIYDGGFPLLVGYAGAMGFAMYDSLRIALTCKDRELAYWAAVVVASNLSIIATCFSYVTFLSPIGLQFWLLAAALHAADLRTRGVKGR